jgi:hypothetical protein
MLIYEKQAYLTVGRYIVDRSEHREKDPDANPGRAGHPGGCFYAE